MSFTIIPTLDLKNEAVVHAKAGNRADYRPIVSPFGTADDPATIARGLLAATGSSFLYIADLDAIAGTGNHFELVRGLSYALPDTTLWIDAGFSDVADCAFWLPLGATLVIGSESVAGIGDWNDIHAAFEENIVLSLDVDAKGRKGPNALFNDSALWPRRVIAMNLGKVGTGSGPDIDGLQSLIAMAGGRSVFAAGGIRDANDLAAIASLKAHGALLATALHANAVTKSEIAALAGGRRP